MNKRKIFVGIEYENAYQSIIKLIENDCFDGLDYSVNNGIIEDGRYEYVLTNNSIKKEEIKFKFEQEGATWFRVFRGENVKDDDSIWNTFLNNITIEYHKRFSVVEYKKQELSKEEESKNFTKVVKCLDIIKKEFYPNLNNNFEVKRNDNYVEEDIYGAVLKLNLSGSTGASIPVIGKVFFIRSNKEMIPVLKDSVKFFDDAIKLSAPDNDEITGLKCEDVFEGNDDNIVDITLNGIENLIGNTEDNFANYLCFSEKVDEDAVNKMLNQMMHNAIELECQRVDVLYITHFKTNSYNYEVLLNGQEVFKAKLSVGDMFTLFCQNCCSNAPIIDKNIIKYNKDGVDHDVQIDINKEHLGLSAEMIGIVKQFSEFNKHLMIAPCLKNKNINNSKRTCFKYRCSSQLFTDKSGDKEIVLCKDCPYLEVVYVTINNEKYYTPNLYFAFDKEELVSINSKTSIKFCKDCLRAFSSEVIDHNKCPLCRKADKVKDEHSKLLYKKYKSFLPITARFKFAKERNCYEDNEIILFVVNKNRYILNKLHIYDSNYIKTPKKLY